jgi:PAS domain-containing protein
LRQSHDRRIEPFDTAPLTKYRQHVSPASINVQPDSDGLVRRVAGAAEWAGQKVPTMPAWLAGGEPTAGSEFFLDFSIDVRSIPVLSFIQLLRGTFNCLPGGKCWSVRSPIELGDWISVPSYRALSGPLLQALAFETLAQDRALRAVRGWPVALGAALLIVVLGPAFSRLPGRRALLLLAGSVLLLSVLAMGLQAFGAIALDTSAGLVGLILAFGTATLGRVEAQARALVGQIGTLPATDDMMRRLVDNSFDAIVTFGADGGVLSYNRAAERIFGVAAAGMIGRHPLAGQAGRIVQDARAGGGHP